MFGIGMPEMLVLLAVALIVFGPKKLPELAKSLGKALGEFKRATSDLKDNIDRQTGAGDVRETFNEIKEDIEAQADLAEAQADLAQSSADPGDPSSDETPEDPLDVVRSAFDEMNPTEAGGDDDDAGPEPTTDREQASEDTKKS